MRKVIFRLVPAALILLLMSCPSPDRTGTEQKGKDQTDIIQPDLMQSNSNGGTLVINLPPIPMQLINSKDPPNLDAVFSYDVSGSGPGNASFQKPGVTLSTVTVDSLDPGDWDVTVNSHNIKGLQIGSTSAQVTIAAGETASMDVAASLIVGDGTFDVYLEWPAVNVVSSPIAALTPQGGARQEITLPAVVTADGLSSIHATAAFKAGSYTLSVSYLDADGFTWGGAEAVHISPESTTKLVFKPFEAVKMTIDPDISKDIAIDFSSLKAKLGQGETILVTATPRTSEKHISYQWYLNGILQPQTAATITFPGRSLSPGDYRLDVVVSVEGVPASNHVLFIIAGN